MLSGSEERLGAGTSTPGSEKEERSRGGNVLTDGGARSVSGSGARKGKEGGKMHDWTEPQVS